MAKKDLRTFERVLAYVVNIKPDYVYLYEDFGIKCDGDEYTIYRWNLKNVPEPTDEDLEAITNQTITNIAKKIKDDAEAGDPILIAKKMAVKLTTSEDRLTSIEARLTAIEANIASNIDRITVLESKVV